MRKGPGRFARFEEHDMLFPVDSSSSETSEELNVSCKGVIGTVAFIENGVFQYTPKKQARSMFGSGGKEMKVLHQEIVGLVKRGSCSFEVWYCQLISNKPGETKRKFVKSPEFTILAGGTDDFGFSPEEAVDGFIQYVRQSCCWGLRSAAPAVGILVHPASGKTKSSQQLQKTLLPILQDAAGLCVDVFDGLEPAEAASVLNLATMDMLVVLGGEGMSEQDQQAVSQQAMQQGNTQTVFIPFASGGGLGSPKSGWCPHTTAHTICKGLLNGTSLANLADMSPTNLTGSSPATLAGRSPATLAGMSPANLAVRSPASLTAFMTPEPNTRQSKFVAAASGILTSIKDAKADLPWKGDGGLVGEVFRDLVNSSKQNIKEKRDSLQPQKSQNTSVGLVQQQNLLLGSGQDSKTGTTALQGKMLTTKSRRGMQARLPFAAVWGHQNRASLSREWSSCTWDSPHEHDDTVPAYRPAGGMPGRDSLLSVNREV